VGMWLCLQLRLVGDRLRVGDTPVHPGTSNMPQLCSVFMVLEFEVRGSRHYLCEGCFGCAGGLGRVAMPQRPWVVASCLGSRMQRSPSPSVLVFLVQRESHSGNPGMSSPCIHMRLHLCEKQTFFRWLIPGLCILHASV